MSVGSTYFREREGMGMCLKVDRDEEIIICKLHVVPSQRTKDMDTSLLSLELSHMSLIPPLITSDF